MNRDEVRQRHEAGIRNTIDKGVALQYPTDGQTGGTWIGTNDQGVTLGLLNRYGSPLHHDRISRGGIIPRALSEGDGMQVRSYLQHLDWVQYNPFDIILASADVCNHFSWDGNSYQCSDLVAQPWFFISSSSEKPDAVLPYRHNLFQQWVKKDGEPCRVLDHFHLQQDKENKSYAVLMQRNETHTKSITQIAMKNNSSDLNYYPQRQLVEQYNNLSNNAPR